jgi:hypothetical protein
MEFLGLLALGVAAMLGVVAGDDSTWSSGRATFYGGNDASGTMGKPTENFIRRLISAVSYNSVLADLRGCRRCVRVRQHVQRRVRNEHGGAEHGAIQQWAELRRML